MRSFAAFILFLGAGIGAFLWLIHHIGLQELVEAARSLSLSKELIIALLTLLMFFVGAVRWRVVLEAKGHKLPVWFLFKAYTAGFVILFFVPMIILGNEFFRAYAVKEKYDVPFPKAMASAIIERILEVTTQLIIVMIGIAILIWRGVEWSEYVEMILGGIVIVTVALSIFYWKSLQGERLLSFFLPKRTGGAREIEREIVQFFHAKNRHLFSAFLLSFARNGASYLRTLVLLTFIADKISPILAIPVVSISFISFMIPIPAALGAHDILQAFTFPAIGLEASQGAVFALAIRGAEFLAAVLGIVWFITIGSMLMRSFFERRFSKLFNGIL